MYCDAILFWRIEKKARIFLLRQAIIIVALLSHFNIAAGQSWTISGYVEDASSGERLQSVAVGDPALSVGTVSNRYGFYSLTVRIDSLTLLFSHVGYESASYPLILVADTTIDAALAPRTIELAGVEVTAHQDGPVQPGWHEVSLEQVKTLPVLLGEVDIQKTLQLLPGVQGGVEGSSGMHVRGGRLGQNLILLDGLPLYNPNHLFGFLSAFNAGAMKHVELIKGGFPARYGGRISSVLNLTMKEGNLKEFAGEASIGILSSQVTLEGPLKKDRASFLLAARRTYIEPLLVLARMFQKEPPVERSRYFFHDANLKANYILSRRDRLYVSAYTGQDGWRSRQDLPNEKAERDRIDWFGHLASFRWNRILGSRTFANTLIGITNYRFEQRFNDVEEITSGRGDYEDVYEGAYFSTIRDLTAKTDIEYLPNPRHYIRFGLEGTLHRFIPGAVETALDVPGQPLVRIDRKPVGTIRSQELALYAEDDLDIPGFLQLNPGLRFSIYFVEGRTYRSFEPRLSVRRGVTRQTMLHASYTAMQQYVHLLQGNGFDGLTVDLWLPIAAGARPQRAHQVAAGATHAFPEAGYDVSLEGYYKWVTGLIQYKGGVPAIESAYGEWPDLVESGDGLSYGVEVLVRKTQGHLTGWVAYTLARTTRKFDNLNGGKSFPDRYDRRHDIAVVVQHRLTPTIDISANWVFGSGYAIWLPDAQYPGWRAQNSFNTNLTPFVYHYGPRNASRLPAYHRLDLSVRFRKGTRWGEQAFVAGAYNAYNKKNPFRVEIADRTANPGLLRQITLFPLLPSLAYNVKF